MTVVTVPCGKIHRERPKGTSVEFVHELIMRTKQSVREDFVILVRVILAQCQRVTDRQTDGRTDGHPDRS